MSFRGTGSSGIAAGYWSCPEALTINPFGGSLVTIVYWFKTSTVSNRWSPLMLANGALATPAKSLMTSVGSSLDLEVNDGVHVVHRAAGGTVPVNAWSMVGLSVDGTGRQRITLNGTEVASYTYAALTSFASTTLFVGAGTSPFDLAQYALTPASGTAKIAELLVVPALLPDTSLAALYNAAASPADVGLASYLYFPLFADLKSRGPQKLLLQPAAGTPNPVFDPTDHPPVKRSLALFGRPQLTAMWDGRSAARSITITSPASGSTIYPASFTVAGTFTGATPTGFEYGLDGIAWTAGISVSTNAIARTFVFNASLSTSGNSGTLYVRETGDSTTTVTVPVQFSYGD